VSTQWTAWRWAPAGPSTWAGWRGAPTGTAGPGGSSARPTARTLTTWTVRFDAPGYRRGTATLDIALAGAVGGNSSYRLGCRGMYRRVPPITFRATLLARGANALTFSPVRPPKAPLTRGNTVDDWMEPIAGLMYDTIA
jgi:rhamnogalacturonan endolyase